MGVSLRTGVLLAACAAALAWSGTAAAETYTVEITGDTVTETSDGHSLRSAIIAANANPGRDTIVLPSGLYVLTLGGAGENAAQAGDLDITDDLTIDGAGSFATSVDANELDRAFHIPFPIDGIVLPQVTIEGVRITNGLASTSATEEGGGAIWSHGALTLDDVFLAGNEAVDVDGFSPHGGALLSSGPLTVTDSTLSGNEARNTQGTAFGGGLAVLANGDVDISITRTLITQNTASGFFCGPARGGGIYLSNGARMTITDSEIGDEEAGNEAHGDCFEDDEAEGGGIYNATSGGGDDPTELVLVRTVVQNNRATFGAGIYNAGPLTISEGSSVESNDASAIGYPDPRGGGIYNRAGRLGPGEASGLAIVDSFVRGNTVHGDGEDSTGQGGGIYNDNGFVHVTRSEVTSNSASSTAADADGGGIRSQTFSCSSECGPPGQLRLVDSLVAENTADDGGGIRLSGGGDLYEQARIEGSEISGNTGIRGAGLYVRGEPGTTSTKILETTISGNTADTFGGGVYSREEDLTVERSTVSGNTVTGDGAVGGGLYLLGSGSVESEPGTATFVNSTVSGNSAGVGGGIASGGASGTPTRISLTNSTIYANSATTGQPGSQLVNAGEAEGRNTIVADGGADEGENCGGNGVEDLGGNIDEDESCLFGLGVDPLLGPLVDNGGPTLTHLPTAESGAIDGGTGTGCPETDQRGVGRPQGDACDIGSVEVAQGGGGGPDNFIVDDDRVQCPTAAFTTIQSAIDAAPDGTTITVCAGLYTQQVAVHNRVTLQGPGADPTADCATWGPADPATDAIVDSDGIGISLQVSDITVDGLVLRGNTTGIEMSAEFSGFQILDNVLAGNTFGVELANGSDDASDAALVSRNCFTGNTRAGLHTPVLARHASIDANSFVVPPVDGAESWGVFLGQIACCSTDPRVFDVTVTNNTATGAATGVTRFAELSSTRDVTVAGNTATTFSSTHVFLANNNQGTLVVENDFADGNVAVWISQIAFVGGLVNTGVSVSGNEIDGMGGYGIGVESGNSLNASTISSNTITDSGEDGIRIQGGANGGNTISANTISTSGTHDCHDDTTGAGTAGTANTWVDNTGATSQPPALCGAGTLSVSDAGANEGDSLAFTVTLDRSSSSVTVAYATRNGTATAGSDYTSTSGTLTFGPGELSKTVTVPTTEDAADESDETLFLDLSSPTGATIADGEGLGTIQDDDEVAPTPAISIADASVNEGNAGTTELTFTLTRTPATGESRVSFATADGSATAGSDYASTSGLVVFGAGEGTKTVTVEVSGDVAVEPDETLFVNLSSPVNATVSDAQGQGTITNDDVAVVPAELALTKTDSPDPVTVGRDLTYTVTVTNSGPGAAQNVVVTDTLPAGVFFTFASSSQGTCNFIAPQVICTVGTVGAPATVVITIVIQPITTGTLTNSATVTTTTPEGNTGNNTAQTTTTVNPAPAPPSTPQAKLDVIKTDEKDPVNVGQNIKYLITVDNDGAGDAHNVRLDDALTDGVQFVSATPSQGTCAGGGGNVTCQLGTIASGASASVDLVVRALRSGTVTNTVRATTTSPADEELNSDFEQTTINPEAGDLAIEKDVFTPLERAAAGEQRTEKDRAGAAAVGRDFTYVLTAANDGPSPVANVVVEDQLPRGLTAKSVQTSKGACTTSPKSTFVECALGELAEGEIASITIIVRPTKAGLYANVARIEGGAPDPVPVNNRARVETFVVAELPKVPVYRPACNFNGTDGPNQFRGGPKHEVFCGYDGRDDFDAGRGNDVVFAGFGNDLVRVDRGLDYHDGEEGEDLLRTADGDVDVVIGGVGVDRAIVDRLDFVIGVEFICIQTARRNCT